MPEPIKWRSKIILAKIETTYGTDPTPTGAANAMLLTDVTLQPMEGEDVKRNIEQPYLGASESFPVGLRAVLSGSIELVGGGTSHAGTAPAWGPLLRACAAAQVLTPETSGGAGDGKVEYTPISDSHESVAIHFWIGNTRHVLLGCRGTAEMMLSAQGIPYLKVTLTGLFGVPSEQARPTPTLTGFQTPEVGTKTNTPTFTIGGVGFVLRDFGLNLGNDVQPRLLIGSERILIVDREESLSARVEAVPLTTFDPFTLAKNQTPQAVVLEHGTVAGRKVRLDVAKAAVNRLSSYEENQNILEWPLTLTPLPTAGNDQWKVTLT